MTVQRREQLDLDREAELSKELEEGFDGWEIFRPPNPSRPATLPKAATNDRSAFDGA